jgi:MSHA pilin protein MshA
MFAARRTPCRRAVGQRGTSLPELAAAVLVAGSVSAAALPKLTELPREARMAVVMTMEGAVRSASSLLHMKCAVTAGCDLQSGSHTVMAEGDPVQLRRGYPMGGHAGGIANALEFTGFEAVHRGESTKFVKTGSPEPDACAVVYEAPWRDGLRPAIKALTSGC